MVLKNYKYSILLFLNTLRCNHLSTKIKTKKKKVFFFNPRLARIFYLFLVEFRSFIVVMLKILPFSISIN